MVGAFVLQTPQNAPLPLGYGQRPQTVNRRPNYATLLHVRDASRARAAGIPMVVRQTGPSMYRSAQSASHSLNERTVRFEERRPDKLLDLETLPVPQQFASIQAQLLLDLVNQETEDYLKQVKKAVPPSCSVPDRIPTSKQTILKKRVSQSFRYQPFGLGQADYEDYVKKRNKKRQTSQHVSFSAFGRTISSDLVDQKKGKSDISNESDEKSRYSTHSMKNARKNVMDKLHNYRINAQARLLLEKRAASYMKEREVKLEAAVQKSLRK